MTAALLVLLGAFAGGFVSGLTGFGTGLTALAFWLHAVPPILAAPLVVTCSVVAQLQTLPAIWHAIDRRRAAPFVAGGLVGVPLGAVLLPHVSAGAFKLMVGAILIVYCSAMLLRRVRVTTAWGGRGADAVVGLGGGILGGLAGLSGVLPTLWAELRDWGKDARRGVFQAFNLTILATALAAQAAAGVLTVELGRLVLIALPGTVVGAWLGRRLYDRLADERFNRVVLSLLLLSGAMLIATNL